MSQSSLEYKVETLFIAILQASLPGFAFQHFDDNVPGALNIVTVRAIQGRQILEGCKPFEVEVTMEARGKAVEGQPDFFGDNAAQGMLDIFEATGSQFTAQLAAFSHLSISPESVGDRRNEKNDRERQFKVPVVAKLA